MSYRKQNCEAVEFEKQVSGLDQPDSILAVRRDVDVTVLSCSRNLEAEV